MPKEIHRINEGLRSQAVADTRQLPKFGIAWVAGMLVDSMSYRWYLACWVVSDFRDARVEVSSDRGAPVLRLSHDTPSYKEKQMVTLNIESGDEGPTWSPRATTRRTDDITLPCTKVSTSIVGRPLRLAVTASARDPWARRR